ncbi:MAG: hypothetical protein HQ504_13290 [Rhodospirillaceae bacterium]|nr:hypothetical protein [Rhodospirillaceae bacterium]
MKTPPPGKSWNEFSRWCRSRGLVPMPAHPWTVAAYLRWCEPRHKLPAIIDGLKAIARRHLLRGCRPPDRHPTVMNTLKRIELKSQGNFDRSALFRDTDFVESEKQPQKKGKAGGGAQKKTLRSMHTMRSSPRLVTRRTQGD